MHGAILERLDADKNVNPRKFNFVSVERDFVERSQALAACADARSAMQLGQGLGASRTHSQSSRGSAIFCRSLDGLAQCKFSKNYSGEGDYGF
ncbi:MAG: hypothetical protein CMQ44_00615 [Gammaproteobacteria bacterium]|nr:hypothetical protein [Gammaproteobacteria bacterium]